MRKFLILLLALLSFRAEAQDSIPTGTITGRVIDAKTGNALSEVGVQLVGTTRGVQTGLDGRFRFSNVPIGTVTLQARRIGYQPKQITGLFLNAGETLDQTLTLDQTTVVLTAVVATAEAERGSVNAALDQQRNATAIVSSLGAEQISKSPDGDAAQALQRMSGVTVQDGKNLNVRGLDPRYTTASLNGARLPSPEPERKVVPFLHLQHSEKGVTRLMSRYGGRPLSLQNSCAGPAKVEGENRLWFDCVQRIVQSAGDTTVIRLFGGVYERHGRFKLFSYSNDL